MLRFVRIHCARAGQLGMPDGRCAGCRISCDFRDFMYLVFVCVWLGMGIVGNEVRRGRMFRDGFTAGFSRVIRAVHIGAEWNFGDWPVRRLCLHLFPPKLCAFGISVLDRYRAGGRKQGRPAVIAPDRSGSVGRMRRYGAIRDGFSAGFRQVGRTAHMMSVGMPGAVRRSGFEPPISSGIARIWYFVTGQLRAGGRKRGRPAVIAPDRSGSVGWTRRYGATRDGFSAGFRRVVRAVRIGAEWDFGD